MQVSSAALMCKSLYFSVISVKRQVVMLPTMKQQRLQSRVTNFQHSWLNKRSMSFCVTTEMWWPVYIEDKGLFCLLCKQHDTYNPQNKSKVFNKEPCKRFRPEDFEDHWRRNKWTQFQRRCYRGFPCFREPLTNAKESQKMCCWRYSQLRIGSWKESYLTTRSSHMQAPELTCIPVWRPLKKPSNQRLRKIKTYYFSVSECGSFL